MDEFLIVLAVALILLGVLMVVWGPQARLPPDNKPVQPSTDVSSVAEFSVGPVGFVSTVPAKTVNIKSFVAGTTQAKELKNWGTKEITAGLLESKEFSDTVAVEKSAIDYLDSATLEFSVNKQKSNSAEDLVIKWNGKEIFKGKPTEGRQTVKIPKDEVTQLNSIKISTSAPGIASIVKSTAYSLDDLSLTHEYGQPKVEGFDLEAGELDVFEKGEINFIASPRGDSTGKVAVKVNGIEVYNKKPDWSVLVGFDQKKVPNIGPINKVSILSEGGLYDISDAKVSIYLLTTTVVKKKSFNLASDQLTKLKNSDLRLEVDAVISKAGKLTINLNNRTIEFPDLQTGKNSKAIYFDDLKEGQNTIEFSAMGYFIVPEARIVAE